MCSVQLRKFVAQYPHRPAVGDDVMQGDQQHMCRLTQADKHSADQRTGGEIEGATVFGTVNSLERAGRIGKPPARLTAQARSRSAAARYAATAPRRVRRSSCATLRDVTGGHRAPASARRHQVAPRPASLRAMWVGPACALHPRQQPQPSLGEGGHHLGAAGSAWDPARILT